MIEFVFPVFLSAVWGIGAGLFCNRLSNAIGLSLMGSVVIVALTALVKHAA